MRRTAWSSGSNPGPALPVIGTPPSGAGGPGSWARGTATGAAAITRKTTSATRFRDIYRPRGSLRTDPTSPGPLFRRPFSERGADVSDRVSPWPPAGHWTKVQYPAFGNESIFPHDRVFGTNL